MSGNEINPPPPTLVDSYNTAQPQPVPANHTDAEPINMNDPNVLPRSTSIAGQEEILYGAPQDIPENLGFFQVDYIFLSLGLDFFAKAGLGILLVTAYGHTPPDFKPALLFMLAMCIVRIIFNAYYAVTHGAAAPLLRPIYLFDILYCMAFAGTYLGAYLALAGTIPLANLPLFLYAHIMIALVRFCLEPPAAALFLPGGAFVFFESIQLLIIAYRLGQGDTVNWTWTLLFYYIIALFLLVIAFFTFIGFLLVSALAIMSQAFAQIPVVLIWAIAVALFAVSWMGLVFYMAVSGFEFLAAANQLGFGTAKGAPDTRIRTTGYILAVCAILTLIALILLYRGVKALVIAGLNRGRSKEVTLKSFAENLNLNVTRVSENFFRPANAPQGAGAGDIEMGRPADGQGQALNPDEGLCIICQDNKSDVMIRPCGHGGFCTDCMKQYLKDKEDCSICRAKIEEVYLLVEDPVTKRFKARGVIKLKK